MSEKPLSVAKMNSEQLEDYIAHVKKFSQGEQAAAIRICECCIKIEAD